jgi:hypothetical protein
VLVDEDLVVVVEEELDVVDVVVLGEQTHTV